MLSGFRFLHSAVVTALTGMSTFRDLNGLGNQAEQIPEEELTGFQITEEYHGTYIQFEAIGGKALGTSEGALSIIHQLQESVRS